MKAFVYPDWERLEVAGWPLPQIAPDEVLLRVAACGICGSELETFKAKSERRRPPLVMGHEFCGTIEAVGREVRGFEAGQKVVSNSIVSCGECARCARGNSHLCAQREIFGMHRPGAFAEFVAVPSRCLLTWPEGVPASAACLAEPLANGVHMVNLSRALQPQTVLVIGAGPIGLMAGQAFAQMLGAQVFMADLSPARLAVAGRLGATPINPKEEDVVAHVRAMTGGEGVDLVVDAVGAGLTKTQSLAAARAGGAAIWIGLHEDEMALRSYEVTLAEKQIFGTYAAKMDELQTALDLMKEGRVDVSSWVQVAPLEESVALFGRMLRGCGQDIKGVITPSENAL